MKLNFNMEDIKYVKLECSDLTGNQFNLKTAVEEIGESEILVCTKLAGAIQIPIPQKISIGIVCEEGLYKTSTDMVGIYKDGEYTHFTIKMPASLDYQQLREFFRVLVNFDCVYTIEDTDSYDAITYDLSEGGVSIITEENAVTHGETSILIVTPEGNIRSHLEFVRSETFDDSFKLVFRFIDLSDANRALISKICQEKQLSHKMERE